LTVVAAAILIVGAFNAWKHFPHRNPAKQAAGTPATTVTPEPAKTPDFSHSGKSKMKEAPKAGPASPDSDGERPAERKDLTYAEQAKIIELNTLADSYYRQGGCEKALPPYQKVLEIDPGNPQAYAAVKQCYEARRGEKVAPIPTITPDDSPNP
jgi:tetratricopeptide (TPR) repeat protein